MSFIHDAVAETLLITLYARAVESQKSNPIISDPIAHQLVASLDYDFSRLDNKPASLVGVVIRARFFDEQAKLFLTKHPNGVIVNLGCGLDSRLERLGELASNTPFYSLDIAEVIELRERHLPKAANETLIKASMFDTSWLELLASKHPQQPVLLLAEGVMMYFSAADNQRFIQNTADYLTHAYLYFDCPSVFFSKKSQYHETVKYTRARFAFGLNNPRTPETWDKRWRYIEHHYFAEFQEIWQMGKVMGFLLKYVPLFQKSFMMVGYQLGADAPS